MQSPGAPRLDNGHGACVADEHVACTKQVIQELPVSHWSVTAHGTGGESLQCYHDSSLSESPVTVHSTISSGCQPIQRTRMPCDGDRPRAHCWYRR